MQKEQVSSEVNGFIFGLQILTEHNLLFQFCVF